MKPHFSVLLHLVLMHIRAEMEYRAAFWIDRVAQIITYGSSFAMIWIIAERFGGIAGWNWADLALLFAFHLMGYSAGASMSFTQMRQLEEAIRLGTLDTILTKPISPWAYMIFSGFAGSAVGTVFFTLALKYGNPTVVNVVLNIQPVISTLAACLLFRDQLAPRFYFFAAIAILAGVFLSVDHPELITTSFQQAGLNLGTGYALVCALFWGLSTVAGRGIMMGMTLKLASSLRIVTGLTCMTLILGFSSKLRGSSLWPAAAQAHPGTAVGALLLLASLSGAIPLLVYFKGLSLTRASTAGYFEMMQTLAAVCITWGFFGAALRPHQVLAAIVLMAAVTMVQRVQSEISENET